MAISTYIIAAIILFILSGLKIIKEYERGEAYLNSDMSSLKHN